MLSTLLRSRTLSSEVQGFSEDLLSSAARRLIWGVLGTAFVMWLVLGISDMRLLSGSFFALGAALAIYAYPALKLADRPSLLAQVVWQAGLAVLITAAIGLYPHSFVQFYYILLPFTAALTIGWQAAVLAEALVIAITALLGTHGLLPPPLSAQSLQVITGGALLGIVGWATADPFFIVTSWAVYYANRAAAALEDARSRHQELEEIREDLLTANQELARLMDRYKALQRVAEEARQAKAEFVANVSHELRAPLNMVIGFSDMIAHSPRSYGSKLPQALLADIAIIQRNATHLSWLIDDVLDLSQIEAGRMALSKEGCSAGTIVEEAASSVRPLFDAKGLYLRTQVPEGLPSAFCDQTRIRQILINLLSNAGRFTSQGGVRVKVDRSGDEFVFSVADTGPGISPEDQARLFEPFQQLDNSIRREHGGSGLGLNISKRFVEMHGGRIWLESQPGQGAVISFSLPVEVPVDTPPVETDPARRWVNVYTSREPRTRRFRAEIPPVLPRFVLLDRGAALARLFARYSESVSVTRVTDLPQALEELQRSPARALVVNTARVRSPSEPPTLWQQLSNLPYGTPAVTCWLPGRHGAARELGVVDYLVKPVTAEQLIQVIDKVRPGASTVLLVDDEPDLLQFFARVLSAAPADYRVWRASTGTQALEIMRERRPDVVVLDLILPGEDGYQVLQEKRVDANIRDIPVIVLSARDPMQDMTVAGTVVVNRGYRMSARELLRLVEVISEVLAPQDQPSGPAQPGNRPG